MIIPDSYFVETLDELTDLVVQLFGDVENKDRDVPCWPEHPYGPDEVKVTNVNTCIFVPLYLRILDWIYYFKLQK